MKLKAVVFWMSVALVAALCSACNSTKKTIELTDKDQSKNITVEKGDLIKLLLSANPTTGYQWEWVKDEAPFLAQKGEPEYKADSNLIGAGGVSVFTFQVNGSGSGSLHLIYHRTFEEGVPPIQEFTVSVEAK
jgi:inhibitor of cysteine peptidase